MKVDKKLALYGLWSALGESVYVALVALLMQNAQNLFGNTPSVVGLLSFLLLFVLSATISGALIFGRPILMYLNGKTKEALAVFIYTVLWLLIILIFALSSSLIW